VLKNLVRKLEERAFARVDIASLVFFRVAFGLLMVWHVSYFLQGNRIGRFWLEPRMLFKYYGFSWVQPWPGNGLYIHWWVLGALALFIAAGFLYRLSTLLFWLGYTYTFLLDEAMWVNHKYLICLFSFLLFCVPAHRAFSIDAWLRPKLRSNETPAWSLWLLRTQIGVVYFFAGVAKLTPDWVHGEPMRQWLARSNSFPIIGQYFREDWLVHLASYASLAFDLSIVPLLLWRRTRLLAFGAALGFHIFNMFWFHIGIFPWLAIAATTLFLRPGWPRRVLRYLRLTTSSEAQGQIVASESPLARKAIFACVLLYIAVQIVVPLRPFFYHGGIEWWQAEHRFTWRMMLAGKWERAYFYVIDPNTGEEYQATPSDYLTSWQEERMQWQSDMILQYAHYLAAVMPRAGIKPLKVELRLLVALNGRKPLLFIDPTVDLTEQEKHWGRPTWLREIHEPLPDREHRLDPMQNPFTLPPPELN
jgi:vitamin K-dependent gamma-carboxylase